MWTEQKRKQITGINVTTVFTVSALLLSFQWILWLNASLCHLSFLKLLWDEKNITENTASEYKFNMLANFPSQTPTMSSCSISAFSCIINAKSSETKTKLLSRETCILCSDIYTGLHHCISFIMELLTFTIETQRTLLGWCCHRPITAC